MTPPTELSEPVTDYATAITSARTAHAAEVDAAIAAGDFDKLDGLRAAAGGMELSAALDVVARLRESLVAAEADLAVAEESVTRARAEQGRFRAELGELTARSLSFAASANPPGLRSLSPAERDALARNRAEAAAAQRAMAEHDMRHGPVVDRAVRIAEDAARPHRARVEDLRRQLDEADRRVRALAGG